MMAGFTSVFNDDSTTLTQTAWVVRTDSLGNSCYIPEGCEWAVGIDSYLPLDPVNEEFTILVYPNPAQNTLTLQWVSKSPLGDIGVTAGSEVELTLLSLTGQPILKTTLSAGETNKTISVAHLPAGVYLCRWQEESGGASGVVKVTVIW